MSSHSSETGPGRTTGRTVLSHLAVMAAVSAVLGVLVAGLAIPFAGVVGMAARDVSEGMDSLPEELEAEDLAQKTRILDADGNLIGSIYDQNRINVDLDQISRTMVEAIVSIEDYRYYSHGALDLRGTLRAFVSNQASGSTQGGSSITQQMVKLTLLNQADTKREAAEATENTYARKLRELRYAIAFEQNYSKDWILERYLNIAYYGDGAHGIQAAARHYFSTNAKNLNLTQSAMLAGLVKNPTGYDPTNNPERARNRRNTVLERMAQLNVITDRQARKAKKKPLGLKVEPSPNGCQQSQAPFFCDYVVNYLLDDPSLGKTKADRNRLIRSGGLTIRTTLDLEHQQAADESVRSHVYPTDQAIGGLAMVEPGTGDVKALAQSRPMGTDKEAGQTHLNYLVPERLGDSKGFQAGSTFKAFTLAAAIKQNIPLTTSIPSPQTISIANNRFDTCDGKLRSFDTWSPENSTGTGTFDLYTGTQKSVNTFFAQLELRTGLCEPYRLAKQMGVELTDPANEMVPPFTLGVASTSPLEMAEAYATFAARGLHCDARPVTAIEDADGNNLKDYAQKCDQVLPGPAADAVNDVLRGVQEGTGFGANAGLALDSPSAGKTGTINENMAVWFVGYTPKLAAASMIAGANSFGHWVTLNGQSIGGAYVSSAAGSTLAGPMWGDAMQVIDDDLPNVDFVPPSGEDIAGVLTTVPSVSGMSVAQATRTLEDAGFEVSNGGYVNSAVTEDMVAYTSPGGGSSLGSGDTVVIYQSTGYVPPPPKPDNGGGNGGGGDGGGNGGGGGGNDGGGGGGTGGGGGGGGTGGGGGGGNDGGGGGRG